MTTFYDATQGLNAAWNITVNNQHDMLPYVPLFADYATRVNHITEFGVGPEQYKLNSTMGLFYGLSKSPSPNKKMICYDILYNRHFRTSC